MPAKGIMKKEHKFELEKENDSNEHIYEEISIISSPKVSFSDSAATEIAFDETTKVCMKE